jgi:arginyl-tRNA synthetase
MMVTDQLSALVESALDQAAADGLLERAEQWSVSFERPRRKEHGDWATSVALSAAAGKGNPRALAQGLVERIPESELVDKIDVAGPGFLNFHLSPKWLHDVIRRAADTQSDFGRAKRTGIRINVEYVSSNPTGPINVVSGRHAAVGDAISSLLDAAGYDVGREFYINDEGRQVRLFGASVAARYLQALGVDADLPEDGYLGDYVEDLARELVEEFGDKFKGLTREQLDSEMYDLAVERMLRRMRASLESFGTTFETWFSQRSLYESGKLEKALARLTDKGVTQEKEGALWFLSSRFGDDKDRVLVRSNGEPTYIAADAAYLVDKFGRGFDHLLYLWGADHHGTVPRFVAVAEALGLDKSRVEVLLMQNVSLSGVIGSKRKGVYVSLDELVDEVGTDAARYTFLMRSIDAPLDFDIELAKEQAPENPVYYVQYAHARICSILRRAADQGATTEPKSASLERLGHPSEDELMRKLASFEEIVPEAAHLRAPQRITRYIEELASLFSAFYRDCRVVSDDDELTRARLTLCLATKRVIADALGLLGVTAPERM